MDARTGTRTKAGRSRGPLIWIAIATTAVLVLFPPFTSIGGTEHAFILTGPAWARRMDALGGEPGLRAHIHWTALAVRVTAVWLVVIAVDAIHGALGRG